MYLQKDRLILNKHCMAFLKKRGTPPESFVLYMKNTSEKTKNGFFSEFLHSDRVGVWFRNSNARSTKSQSKEKRVAHHQKLWFQRITWPRNYEILIVLTVPRFGMFRERELMISFMSQKLVISIPAALYSNSCQSQNQFLPERASKKWNEIRTIARFDSSASPIQVSLPEKDARRKWEKKEEGSKLQFLFKYWLWCRFLSICLRLPQLCGAGSSKKLRKPKLLEEIW